MSRTLRLIEVKQDLACVLVREGLTPAHADRLAECQAKFFHRKHQGERTYWAKGRVAMGMDVQKRKEIYLEWFEFGKPGKEGEGMLAVHGISTTTLDRIIREGRRNKWGAR